MELFITAIFFIGISLIATEIFNKVNKAAVAMFMGVTCFLPSIFQPFWLPAIRR